MKFFLPESEDLVDSEFNFENECYHPKRQVGQTHDVYTPRSLMNHNVTVCYNKVLGNME